MNWLLVTVLLVFALGIVWGYVRGLLMMVYSLLAWVLSLLIVSCATPIIASAVISGTSIDERMEEQIILQMREFVHDRGSEPEESSAAQLPGLSGSSQLEDQLSDLGIHLPQILTEQLIDTGDLPDQALQRLGIYEVIARNISHMVIQGATFLIVLFFTRIVFTVIGYTLNIISRIKGIREVNKFGGAALGFAEALIVVWIGLAVISIAGTSSIGRSAVALVYDTWLLPALYENNLIVNLLGLFL